MMLSMSERFEMDGKVYKTLYEPSGKIIWLECSPVRVFFCSNAQLTVHYAYNDSHYHTVLYIDYTT